MNECIVSPRRCGGTCDSMAANPTQFRKKRDFTLIELLVVIAIIAIMIASKAGFFLQFSAIFVFKAL